MWAILINSLYDISRLQPNASVCISEKYRIHVLLMKQMHANVYVYRLFVRYKSVFDLRKSDKRLIYKLIMQRVLRW